MRSTVVEPRLAQARLTGLSWSGKGYYRFLFGSVIAGAQTTMGRLEPAVVEWITADSEPIHGGRVKIMIGSVDIYNGREIIIGVETLLCFQEIENVLRRIYHGRAKVVGGSEPIHGGHPIVMGR